MKKKWLPERVLTTTPSFIKQKCFKPNCRSMRVPVSQLQMWAGSTEAGIDSWKHWLKFILRLETLGTTEKPALWEWMALQDV